MENQFVPFYESYPMYDIMERLRAEKRDIEYMRQLYPKSMMEIQNLVEEECDKMEYDGSLMFDQYPDRLGLRLICRRIQENAKCCQNNDWARDVAEVLFYNELYKRRCRRRNYR